MIIDILSPNREHKRLIKNMFVLYRYDLLPFQAEKARLNSFGVLSDHEANSHYDSVDELSPWWDKLGILFPFLIQADSLPVGFVMIATSPYCHATVDYRISEFFIVNKYRGKGIGKDVITQLCARFSGFWELGWLAKNHDAEKFWRKIVPAISAEHESWSYLESDGQQHPGLRFEITAQAL